MGYQYRLGFAMARTAGHATHVANLAKIARSDSTVEARWTDVRSHVDGGRVESITSRLGRGQSIRHLVDLVGGLRFSELDALLTNVSEIALYPRRLRRCPVLVDFDSTPAQLAAMPEYARPIATGRLAGLRDARVRRLWDDVHTFVAWSEWAKASAVNDYRIEPERVVVNPPGVDLDLWAPLQERHRRTNRPTRILFVGGDLRRKGGHMLVEWFTRRRPADTELHLVTREPVEPTAGVIVHTDLTPNSDRLVSLYRNSDVFVLPSSAECFGIATVEAMAVGLPVIVGDVGASSEIVEDGRNGHLVRPGDINDLGDALAAVLGDEDSRQQMGQRSRALAAERYDAASNAAATLDLMKMASREAR